MEEASVSRPLLRRPFPNHGWIGLGLAVAFWAINWLMPGKRTTWAFFPMWLGYALLVDALTYWKNGNSLLSRNWRAYIGLFLLSAPGWWLFEALNLRVHNWNYLGVEGYPPWQYFLLASLNFSVVMPAVFGAAEWFSGMQWIRRMGKGLTIRPDRQTALAFFLLGLVMLALLLVWPLYFFPFAWLALLFIIEPINIWLGNPSLSIYTGRGDWRPLVSLFCGVLLTGFFWEMWNFFSFPKWIYTVPWVGFAKVFEMPVLGYTGYLPFSLELYALYHLLITLVGFKNWQYVELDRDDR